MSHSVRLAVDFLARADLDDQDDQCLILDRINDPIIAVAGQFLPPLRTRIVLLRLHAIGETLLDRWNE